MRICVLTTNYELRVSRKSHLRVTTLLGAQFRGHWGWDGLRGVRKILGVGGGGDKTRGSDKKDSLQKLDKHLGPVWSVVTINPNMVTFYVC
jgi:hypothetical protein